MVARFQPTDPQPFNQDGELVSIERLDEVIVDFITRRFPDVQVGVITPREQNKSVSPIEYLFIFIGQYHHHLNDYVLVQKRHAVFKYLRAKFPQVRNAWGENEYGYCSTTDVRVENRVRAALPFEEMLIDLTSGND